MLDFNNDVEALRNWVLLPEYHPGVELKIPVSRLPEIEWQYIVPPCDVPSTLPVHWLGPLPAPSNLLVITRWEVAHTVEGSVRLTADVVGSVGHGKINVSFLRRR